MPEPAISLLLSACLGALIGLIRQWENQQDTKQEAEFAGLRTFTVVAMLGWVAAFASSRLSPLAFPVTLGVLGLFLAVAQYGHTGERPTGYTTSGAALLTFFVGGLAFWGEAQTAVLVAALMMILIGLKQPIHQWTRRFTSGDVRTVLQFVAITGVILPLVPNRAYGPFNALNPWATWLMVVLISGLGFLGYLFSRMLGSQAGIALTGLVGGLASSTATTLTFSRRSRDDPGSSADCALAIVIACNVMLARVVVVTAAISPGLAGRIWPLLAVMALPGLGYAGWVWLSRRNQAETVASPLVANPLQLSTAIKFALLYAGVSFLVKAATELKLSQGILILSGVAGLTDVDAITLSMSEGFRGGTVVPMLATSSIVVACITNTLAKAGIAAVLGSSSLRRLLLIILGATAAVGVVALFVGVRAMNQGT